MHKFESYYILDGQINKFSDLKRAEHIEIAKELNCSQVHVRNVLKGEAKVTQEGIKILDAAEKLINKLTPKTN